MEISEIKALVETGNAAFENGIETVQKRIDSIEAAANRRDLFGGSDGTARHETEDQALHRRSFVSGFLRKGHETGLADLESKAMQVSVDPSGGYMVPTVLDQAIESLLIETSPIRSISRVISIETSDWKTLVNRRGTASGWTGETSARPATATPSLGEIAPTIGEIYAQPAISQKLLDDSAFDVEGFINANIADEFSFQEGTAFVAGDGINKPLGFLSGTPVTTDDATRAFGILQYTPTGAAGAFAATDPADILYDLIDSLRAGYRQGAVFVMNSSTANVIRKFKDANNQYLWTRSLIIGQPDNLLGHRVVIAEDMPDIAANSLSIAFGNFQRGYVVVDRTGTRMLRDPFTNKPFVNFYATKRVGGCVVNSEAIKLLKFAAT